MVPLDRFHRIWCWMVLGLVCFIFAGTALAAVSEFRVNTYTTGFQDSPSTAMNDDGNVVITWASFGQDGSQIGIYAQRYDRHGNPLGGEFRVNTTTLESQDAPTASMDAAGNFVIAWQSRSQDVVGTWGINAQRYDAQGNPLGGEFQVNTVTAGHQEKPCASMNPDGNFVIAWQSPDLDHTGVFARLFDANGNPLGGEIPVNTTTAAGQTDPSVSLNAAGNFVVAWQSFDQDAPLTNGIYARRFDANGNPLGGEILVNTTTAAGQTDPTVSLNAAGSFVVAWQSFNQDAAGTWGIYARRFDTDGSPLGGEIPVNTHIADSQQNPSVSLNNPGNFVIAWQSNLQDTDGWGIYAQRFDAVGNPLGTEFKVNTYTSNFQLSPSVSLNTTGQFLIAWGSTLQDGDASGIYAQRFDASGNLVGSETQVNNTTLNTQRYPSAAMDAAGNHVIAWQSYGQDAPFTNGVFARRYDRNGNPQGPEFRVNTFAAHDQQDPTAAMDATGNFVIAWESFNQDAVGTWGIYAQRYTANGNPVGVEFPINTVTAGYQTNPSVSMDATGNFVVAWQGPDSDSNGVYARRYAADGDPLDAVEFQVNTTTPSFQHSPDVAMNAEGRFVITWKSFEQDGSDFGIYAQRYDRDGSPLGGEFRVNTHTANRQDDPKVAMDGEGNFIVVWESNIQDGSESGVYAQRFDRDGNPLGIEFRVNTHTPQNQDTLDVIMDRAGNFLIAWESTDQDGSSEGVYAQHYTRSGTPQGSEFRINTVTDGNQGSPALAIAPHGQWVIAWESFNQDGSDFGIFMKLFKKDLDLYLPLVLR